MPPVFTHIIYALCCLHAVHIVIMSGFNTDNSKKVTNEVVIVNKNRPGRCRTLVEIKRDCHYWVFWLTEEETELLFS